MSLKVKIDADIKTAMLAKEKDTLTALRAIKSAILLAETEKGVVAALTEEVELKLLQKAAKQRKESAEVFASQNRADLAEKELAELAIIEKYLPAQMSEEELKAKITEIIARLGVSSPSEMGKVMGVASKELAGAADGKTISAMIKSILG
jgi:uncharacterized protein YqeY